MSYAEPQELTDLVREVLKDKKQIKSENSEKSDSAEKGKSSAENANNEADNIKKRSKI